MSLESAEFVDNQEARCACVLLLDTSGSMRGTPINQLNEGLQAFKDDLFNNPIARLRVELATVEFNSEVNVIQDFVTIDRFVPPILTAKGSTHMGAAILQALSLIQNRKQVYKDNGIMYYRPWVFMITDGQPEGESKDIVDQAAARIKAEEDGSHVAFFAVGVENANIKRLGEIVVRTPAKLKGLNFKEMFLWLSASLKSVSQTRPGDQVPLSPRDDWAEVQV